MALSESLYPTLQTLEVVLRNAIHSNAKTYFKNDYWFDDPNLFNDPNHNHSHRNAKNDLKQVRDRLTAEKKTHDASRIIAALSFGFWNNLFNACYEQTFWRPLIKDIFLYMPKMNRGRKSLSGRINQFRLLRNRIFHHEPIWHLQNLRQQHDQMLETIGWVEPLMGELVLVIDEFPSVYDNGLVSFEQKLKQLSITKCLDIIKRNCLLSCRTT